MCRFRILALAFTLMSPAAAAVSAGAEPLKIRMDWQVMPGHFAPLIPSVLKYAPGVFRHYGKSYVVEPVRLPGGGPTLTALASDQIEMSGAFSPQQLVLGTVEAKQDLRVIGQGIRRSCRATSSPTFGYERTKSRKLRTSEAEWSPSPPATEISMRPFASFLRVPECRNRVTIKWLRSACRQLSRRWRARRSTLVRSSRRSIGSLPEIRNLVRCSVLVCIRSGRRHSCSERRRNLSREESRGVGGLPGRQHPHAPLDD